MRRRLSVTCDRCTRLALHAGFANEGQLLLVNATSLSELQRRLPGPQATQQPVTAAVTQPDGSTAGNGSGGGALAAGSHNSGGSRAVTTGAAAAIESDFSEASAVLQHPPQPAAAAGASDHSAAAGPSAHPAAGSPAHVARFRPNLLVEGPAAFAEDGWRSVQIGGLSFNVTGVQKPCTPATDSAAGAPQTLLDLLSQAAAPALCMHRLVTESR